MIENVINAVPKHNVIIVAGEEFFFLVKDLHLNVRLHLKQPIIMS